MKDKLRIMKAGDSQALPQSYIELQESQQQSFLATYSYLLLTGVVFLLALAFTMLVSHDQRRLHMPEPWSYALAAQNFTQGT